MLTAVADQICGYGTLLGLAADLREAILARDAPGMHRVADLQRAALAGLHAAVARTADAARRLRRALGLPATASRAVLVQRLRSASHDAQVEQLETQCDALAAHAQATHRGNEGNALLLRQGLAFTGFALRCLTAAEPAAEGYTGFGLPRDPRRRRVVDTSA